VRDTWRGPNRVEERFAGQAAAEITIWAESGHYNAWFNSETVYRQGNAPLSVSHRKALTRMCRLLDSSASAIA